MSWDSWPGELRATTRIQYVAWSCTTGFGWLPTRCSRGCLTLVTTLWKPSPAATQAPLSASRTTSMRMSVCSLRVDASWNCAEIKGTSPCSMSSSKTASVSASRRRCRKLSVMYRATCVSNSSSTPGVFALVCGGVSRMRNNIRTTTTRLPLSSISRASASFTAARQTAARQLTYAGPLVGPLAAACSRKSRAEEKSVTAGFFFGRSAGAIGTGVAIAARTFDSAVAKAKRHSEERLKA
mmetsp:Transcript_123616/g.395455  ORF Transcript_123616/g.395455 Transcript_123616/m.395455 type:complete len:239 (-) Transcript_123616:1083-1799(-)